MAAAMILAEGYTQGEAAVQVGCTRRTIERWCADFEFRNEVDRLSLMVGIANRAERLRIAMTVVRNKLASTPTILQTEKDLLDWLKFAQSETDGAKVDLTTVLEAMEGAEGAGIGKSAGAAALGTG